MITFDNLAFLPDLAYPHADLGTQPKFHAAIKIGKYVFSVVYGGSTYGSGNNSYELGIIDTDIDDFIAIDGESKVAGWLTKDEINLLMNQATNNQPFQIPATT